MEKIRVENLDFYYGDHLALSDISIPIQERQITALLQGHGGEGDGAKPGGGGAGVPSGPGDCSSGSWSPGVAGRAHTTACGVR